MNEVLALLKMLKEPSLIFAGITIIILFKLLLNAEKAKEAMRLEFTAEFSEMNKTQSKMVTLLDLLCTKQLTQPRE